MTPNAYNGYPLKCWDRLREQPFPYSPYDPAWRVLAAEIACKQYSDPTAAFLQLLDAVGPAYAIDRVDNSGSRVPGTLIAVDPTNVLVFVSGTTNFIQLATQAWQARAAATNFGAYATWPLWNSSMMSVAARIAGAVGGTRQQYSFVGHSWGGVVCQLLAVITARRNPLARVACLTFGAPPAGRPTIFGAFPTNIVQADIINDGDPIMCFPPPQPYLTFAIPIIGIPTYVNWLTWKTRAGLLRLDTSGRTRYDDSPSIDWATMTTFLIDVVLNLPTDPGVNHYMPEYVKRLYLPGLPVTPCGMPF